MPSTGFLARRFWQIGLVVFEQGCATAPARVQAVAPPTTTIIIVRHAEKSADDPQDPSLSPAGQDRASALSLLLRDSAVTDIYVTQYKRTRQTAEPLARQFGIPIVERPVNAMNSAMYARDLAQEILTRSAGKRVLVVGHSNTVPDIVKALSGIVVTPLRDADYDRIYFVAIPRSGPARLVETRFGRVSVDQNVVVGPVVRDTAGTIAALFKDTTATNVFATEGHTFRLQTAEQRRSLHATLRAERKLWEAARPRNYEFLLRVGCFCPGTRGWQLIEVRADAPLLARDRTGEAVAVTDWNTFSIDRLYDNLERSADNDSEVQIAFDPRWHFPSYVRTNTPPGPDSWSVIEARALRPI
ncbi:MAG: histidine phosphatase family protein [Gemmatimonadaceae bacterium]